MPIPNAVPITGWGVFRQNPWHLAGVYYSEERAHSKATELGKEYRVAYGENRTSADDFVVLEKSAVES